MKRKIIGWLLITPMILLFIMGIALMFSWAAALTFIIVVVVFACFLKGIDYLFK